MSTIVSVSNSLLGFKYDTTAIAAQHGDLETLKAMHIAGCEWDHQTTNNAAKYGHIECLKYAHENGCNIHWECAAEATKGGHVDCLQYLVENNLYLPDHSYSFQLTWYAMYGGHLECLKYARKKRFPWHTVSSVGAVQYGHLECLKWAYEHGCPFDREMCTSVAIRYNQIECLHYLVENKCPWSPYTTKSAANLGSLYCLKYVIEHGCPWSQNTISTAAEGGHLDCLVYAIEKGCPFQLSKILSHLDVHAGSIQLNETHFGLRRYLMPVVGTELLNETTNKQLYMVCTEYQQLLNFQAQFALLEWGELPVDVVKYIVCEYF